MKIFINKQMSSKNKPDVDDFQGSELMPLQLPQLHDHFAEPPRYLNIPEAFLQPEQAIFYDHHSQNEDKIAVQQHYQSLHLLTMEEVNQYFEIGRKSYQSESRQDKLDRYRRKKIERIWGKKINYRCRQSIARKRVRVKGRFVSKKEANSIEENMQKLENQRMSQSQSVESEKQKRTFEINMDQLT